MRRPFRMANSDLRIRLQKAEADQPVDRTFGVKVASLDDQYEDAIEIKGQPRYKKLRMVDARATGNSPATDGYVSIAYEELERRGITNPDRLIHARITGVFRNGAWCDEDLQITRVDPRGHLSGGPSFVKAHFCKHKDAVGSR